MKIPKIPQLLSEVFEVLKSPTMLDDKLENIILKDKKLEESFLKIVNSKYFPLNSEVKAVRKAIIHIGAMRVKNIIITMALMDLLCPNNNINLFIHSLKCGLLSHTIAEENNTINPDDAYIMGFLHDIGKIVLYEGDFNKYANFEPFISKNDKELIEWENTKFNTNHCKIAEEILKEWKMPNIIIDCIKNHHTPLLSILPSASGIIYVADKITSDEKAVDKNSILLDNLCLKIDNPKSLKLMVDTKTEIFTKIMKN